LIDEPETYPWYEISLLMNYSKIDTGSIPVHACGVIRLDCLFLFGGPSGAGKSTTARLSRKLGAQILDEDQVLIWENQNGNFYANAWGYSLKNCESPIKAIINLIQDEQDHLYRMSDLTTARFIMDRVFEVCGFYLSDQNKRKLFSMSARVARSIPGYTLHFRKSPDFWKLIDAEFQVD
jgi:hypothetical protein